MEHDVFISYSSQDKEAANALCHALEDSKIRCWIAPRDIPAGAQYGDLIDEAIKRSKVVVILFSKTAAISQFVKGEMNIAFEEQKVIIPFRLDNTPLKGLNRLILNQMHWIDAYPDYTAKFDELISAVTNVLGTGRTIKSANEEVPLKKSERKHIEVISLIVFAAIFLLSGLLFFSPKELAEDKEINIADLAKNSPDSLWRLANKETNTIEQRIMYQMVKESYEQKGVFPLEYYHSYFMYLELSTPDSVDPTLSTYFVNQYKYILDKGEKDMKVFYSSSMRDLWPMVKYKIGYYFYRSQELDSAYYYVCDIERYFQQENTRPHVIHFIQNVKNEWNEKNNVAIK